jgi:hypothetical protein
MEGSIGLILRLALSAGLLWAMWADARTQRIPALVTWGSLALGVGAEAWRGHWATLTLLGVLLLDADRRLPRSITAPLVLSSVAIAQSSGYGLVAVTWLVAYLLWEVVPLLGGGDAQLTMGLSGLFPSPFLIGAWLVTQAVVIPILLIWRYRRRAFEVVTQATLGFLSHSTAGLPEQATTRIPGAVLLGLPTLVYLWARW